MADTIKSKDKNQSGGTDTVEVLYQKMGNRWFAFSLVDDEVFVGSISQDEIDTLETKTPPVSQDRLFKVSGNS